MPKRGPYLTYLTNECQDVPRQTKSSRKKKRLDVSLTILDQNNLQTRPIGFDVLDYTTEILSDTRNVMICQFQLDKTKYLLYRMIMMMTMTVLQILYLLN